MNIEFIQSRIQSTLLIDTSRDILEIANINVRIETFEISVLLFALLLCMVIVQENKVFSLLNNLISAAVATVITDKTGQMFQSRTVWLQFLEYGLFAITAVTIIESLPEKIPDTQAMSRLKFSFIYATASFMSDFLKTDKSISVIVCLFGFVTMFALYSGANINVSNIHTFRLFSCVCVCILRIENTETNQFVLFVWWDNMMIGK